LFAAFAFDNYSGSRALLIRIYGFLAAVSATYTFAVIGYSQVNLLNLVDMGIAVDFAMRMQTLQHDLVGMLDLFLPIIIVALLLAFSFAALIISRMPHLRTVGYVLAGTMGIYAVIVSLGLMMGTNPIAVTRSAGGLLSQVAAGAVGGLVFAVVTAKLNSKGNPKDNQNKAPTNSTQQSVSRD
jgi:hypothetical protein|tara:strand:+ start:334 stop:882 length:549 start_codon:yes stop_codon:yes gene_type:complete